MNGRIKTIGTGCALAAFVLCLGAGVWILSKTGFDRGNDAIATGLGLYFIGKAFFVGPLLWIAARQSA